MNLTFEVTGVDRGVAQKAVRRAVAPTVLRIAKAAGKEMVEEANRLMDERFDMNRPKERRRYPGSRRASTALDYRIEADEARIRVGFRVLGGEEVLARIIFMNYGTSPHEIVPSGAWAAAGGGNLAKGSSRPTRPLRQLGSSPDTVKLAFPSPNEGDPYKAFLRVDHPGQAGAGFLEEAAENAATSVGGRFIA